MVLKAERDARRAQSAVIFFSHPIHHIHESPFSAQREPAIKAKMPNYAWLSTIKDGAAAKFRDRRQLRGPFSAIAELSAVIRCSSGEFRRKGEKKKICAREKLEHFLGQQ